MKPRNYASSYVELIYLPVSVLLTLFKTHQLSPVELLEALIARAEQVEPLVNALSEQYLDEARLAAKNAEARYMQKHATIRQLEGIPFSVKDSIEVIGKRCTAGSVTRANIICQQSEPCVDRMIEAGAILHARTTCPEFSWAWTCYSKLNGVTHNPWNLDITPGGSTGGAAAALAAGTTSLSLGEDSAGSIRMPSAMCGVIGFKPPAGRNPVGLNACEDLYNSVGPLARTVDDCRLMQNILNGAYPKDPFAIYPPLTLDFKSIKGLKIAYSLDFNCYEVDQAIKANTLNVIDYLRQHGAIVEEVTFDFVKEAFDKADAYGNFITKPIFQQALTHPHDELSDYTPYFAQDCIDTRLEDYIESYKNKYRAWAKFQPVLMQYDSFICPTVATNNIPASMKPWEEMKINNVIVDRYVFTMLFNVFNSCPVLAVPSGKASNGVPTGIQIVGRPLDDNTVFSIGNCLEAEFGFFKNQQSIPLLNQIKLQS